MYWALVPHDLSVGYPLTDADCFNNRTQALCPGADEEDEEDEEDKENDKEPTLDAVDID